MAKHRFNACERFAVWRAYDGVCFWCGKPVVFNDMEVDHLIAESLADKPLEFAALLKSLSLPETYSVNDYPNWVAACGDCNGRKGAATFAPAPMILFLLEKTVKVGEACRAYATELLSDRQKSLLLSRLAFATEKGAITEADLREIGAGVLAKFVPVIEVLKSRTTGLNIEGDWVILRQHFDGTATVVGSRGVGVTPVGPDPDSSWRCEHCGSFGPWRGINCVLCGHSQPPEPVGY